MTARNSVGVNLLWLIPGVVGGSEEYTVGLLNAIAGHEHDLALTLYCQPALLRAYPHLGDRYRVETLPVDVALKPLRFGLECSWLAMASRRDRLVHHGGGVLPLGWPRGRSIVTIHDLQPVDLPANFSAGQRRWFAVMLPRAARTADRLIVPSEFTANRLIERFGCEPKRIAVVPPVHQILSPAEVSEADQQLINGLGRYVLYPAVTHRHKRHADALGAFAQLADAYPDLQLVFTGGQGAAADEVERQAADLGSRVRHLGRVSAPLLDQLIRQAAVLAFPSVYEGFGNPVLEAMARNTPVVAADATALGPVCGGAALLVEPESPTALAAGLASVLDDPERAAELRRLGVARAADFGPASAAAALISAYCDTLG
ncbi:MAG: glycosyltransferase involved in cell wall biosynthesis [Acidimicrobiales bacterium]|jgi:glycosyltransferase involved in cell wall biosynthesis